MELSRKFFFLMVILSGLFILIIGCSGGGGDGGGGGVAAAGEVSGSVGGTTVIAVADGDIVASEDTSGRIPDVDKDGDLINESFSFTLTDIPLDHDIRIYLVVQGEIFPLYFDSNGDGTPDTNVFSLTSETNVNLGFIDINDAGQAGRAIPENDPTDNGDVTAGAEATDFPISLNQPDTSGLTLSQLITDGLDAVKDGWVLRAKAYFSAAEALAGATISNDADTARFFYALTRVAALGVDSYSDGNPGNGLNMLGDILDTFGCPTEDARRSTIDGFSFPDPLPGNSSDATALQGFLYNVVRPELLDAIANLGAVSQAFNREWTEPNDDEIVESDYGDVLFFKASFEALLAYIFVQNAYTLNGDIDDIQNNGKTIQQVLADEPDLLKLSAVPGGDLNSAKTAFDESLVDFDAAIVWINNEGDFQDDDFVNLSDTTAEEINQARADIADARASLNGTTVVNDNRDPADGFELDMSVFFAGLDLRNPNLLPAFSGNDPTGLFPDPTFDGVFGAGIYLNLDSDPADGTADILQHTPFYGGPIATGEISGSVSGTTVIAVADGDIVASEDTSGRIPDVDKDGDLINESFSFTLQDIPLGFDIRIYLVSKGEIFPLYYDSNGDGTPDTNVFLLTSEASVNLGFIDTNYAGQDGRAIPLNDPTDNVDVTAGAEATDFPVSLNQPDTSGLTLSQLITEGLDAVKDGWVLRAKAYFAAAEALAGVAMSNDADTARFFYALTRVAALGANSYSDGIPGNGLNMLGDILDAFGCPTEDASRSTIDGFSIPDPLPGNSPDATALQSFLYNVVRPELSGALSNLGAVSQAFNREWTEPNNDEIVESDFGDVLFFKAAFEAVLADIFVKNAYTLNGDIDDIQNNAKTSQQVLADEPDLLKLSAAPSGDLNSAKIAFDASLFDFDAAIVWMNSEADFQNDDFVNLRDSTAEEINQARADIADARNSLNGQTVVNDNRDPADGFELDMSVFFDGLDLRSPNLLPAFVDNDPTGLFPDPTFDGMFGAGININEDNNPNNGTADILQDWPYY